jgi:hypothetical protein
VAQVALAEDDDMIKTFVSDRADQPFRMAILPWGAWRSWPVANAHGAILYADRKLMTPEMIARLATQFHLPEERTEMHVSRCMQTNART